MADSPAFQAPLDPNERPILDHLLAIRDKLCLLKQDKSTYVKSHDVISLHDQVIEQVHKLNTIRNDKRLEQNRVDRVLDDCFQLISLFFMTIGRIHDVPAVYATSSTIKRLLDHLAEAAPMFSEKDLESISRTIGQMSDIIQRGKDNYSPQLVILLEVRLEVCRAQLSRLHDHLSNLSPELAPVHEQLISILRSIAAANTRTKFPTAEVKGFQSQLKDIEDSKVDGNFVTADGAIPAGQQILDELLSRCQKWADTVLDRHGKFDDGFKPTYEKLCDIRNQLEKLSLTQAWSLRETDLYSFQRQLDRIDEARVDGKFVDEQGNAANLFCQRLSSIDNMQVDGKFMVGPDVPEGQGSVKSLLAECFDLCHDLQVEAEERGSDL
ncbi:hypothetical protein FGG08_001849 [Glutinoglossum americanum]|uniref:Uncharacterized protein n=1 Tax=Glutinoglossum americanum TaxID=1670608 RepID=A0A9P8ICN1_9PEZI|nr:hypothetical protein FGG08_001849 [Glutinoglossum americanum]